MLCELNHYTHIRILKLVGRYNLFRIYYWPYLNYYNFDLTEERYHDLN